MDEQELEKNNPSKVGQEQIHGLLFSDKLSWQSIIYDLINSEQLDPWDVDICMLSSKYLVKVRELEEADFFVSSKVLLAASLLLRIKSEILLNRDLPDLDDILFGKEEEKTHVQERIELEDDIPDLVPRTPLPRGRKVTLQELMSALGKVIKTETRRIKRVVVERQREMFTAGIIPRKFVDLKDQVKEVYTKIKKSLSDEGADKIPFSKLSGYGTNEKISHFMPLLHLDNQHKIVAEQEKNFDEIWIWLKATHQEKHAEMLEQARREVIEAMKDDGDIEEASKLEESEKTENESVSNK